MGPSKEIWVDVVLDLQASRGQASTAPAVDEGSALLSMDEQEEAFVDTSVSNGTSPGEPGLANTTQMWGMKTHCSLGTTHAEATKWPQRAFCSMRSL